ncbi:hypothetical protein DQ244_05845 [Blastococcus sp. TBT05-19]|uniref:Rv0361 family membrane protein n=1 Tax=Blastococcus sp. TBT05-19 TaxID=2250581 RepID=UPI000DF8AF5E|nr:hypothetical protein [Blastococcus sp. TBT05-19]RBY94788.1 hypothetical protein DQ244_05845 [Blastococcus sp. TBT05-19]
MTSQGPFLYDDGPAPLHTGTPRSAKTWIVAGIVGIVLLSGAMVGFLYLLKGSPQEQATQAAEVFVASMSDGDTETAYQMLCEDERNRLEPGEVAGEYLGTGVGEVGEVRDDDVEGAAVQLVAVGWDDGTTTELRVLNEDGPRICGIAGR